MINVSRTFKSTPVIKMGLSDFHLMILTVMKKYFRKLQLRYINYWSYEDFYNEGFRKDLIRKVVLIRKGIFQNDDSLQRFCSINIEILNEHAPGTKRYIRADQMLFVRKILFKAIMKRTHYEMSF